MGASLNQSVIGSARVLAIVFAGITAAEQPALADTSPDPVTQTSATDPNMIEQVQASRAAGKHGWHSIADGALQMSLHKLKSSKAKKAAPLAGRGTAHRQRANFRSSRSCLQGQSSSPQSEFVDTMLSGANMTHTCWLTAQTTNPTTGKQITQKVIADGSNFGPPNSYFTADLTRANLSGAHFENANFTLQNFGAFRSNMTNMDNINVTNACLSNASNFTTLNMQGLRVSNANLNGAIPSGLTNTAGCANTTWYTNVIKNGPCTP